ncbi:hypothetical protein ACIBL3_03730 [Kribbella sp. NPDC050124]|uniref:hypothetical protein n=1 Tax=Kribbella sp. NPDC050124 TaxID=3364114 RepID=UPI00379CD429
MNEKSPYGRGFIAACIVVAAVLLCGALLLISSTRSTTNPAATPNPVQSTSAAQTDPGSVAQPVAPSRPAAPANQLGSGCVLPAGDQAIPLKPPAVDGWDVSRRVVVPRSTTAGPAKTDSDGFRRCFAHSPTGAVFAAYNVVAALADQRQSIPTVRKLMLPGPDTQALIHELSTEKPSTNSTASQLAGYRVLDANQHRATIMLAIPVESAYMSLTLTLVWHDNDWRLQPPPPGEPVGTPFAQHQDLSDFVRWTGV